MIPIFPNNTKVFQPRPARRVLHIVEQGTHWRVPVCVATCSENLHWGEKFGGLSVWASCGYTIGEARGRGCPSYSVRWGRRCPLYVRLSQRLTGLCVPYAATAWRQAFCFRGYGVVYAVQNLFITPDTPRLLTGYKS